MSGLGRDWPAGDASGHWPSSLVGQHPPPYSGVPFPEPDDLLSSLTSHTMVAEPYTFPVYSNTGFALLGLANVAAANLHQNCDSTIHTHAELMERDVFGPLGFNGSFFAPTQDNEKRLAVSSSEPWETVRPFESESKSTELKLQYRILASRTSIIQPEVKCRH